MKIILLITVCNQNKQRIKNQINNLKYSLNLSNIKFHPIFLFGSNGDVTGIPYETMIVDVDEKYNFLFLKLNKAYKIINEKYDYDFICKIDDDTKINLELFKKEWIFGCDYIGRIFDDNLKSTITIDMDFCQIHKTIDLKPNIFNGVNFKYASGDCYFLSKKSVNFIQFSDIIVDNIIKDGNRVNEDRMFGYILRDKNIIIKDINLINTEIKENDLQVTTDYFTIHPINEYLYPSLIGVKIKEQMFIINEKKPLNLITRKIYQKQLEDTIKKTIIDFVNSKKAIGMG